MPPKLSESQPTVSFEALKLIETKAKLRAKNLAEEKRLEIDKYMNEILY